MLRRVSQSCLACLYVLLQSCTTSLTAPELHVFNGLVTNGGSGPKFEVIPMTEIHQKDTIYVITHVRWEPATSDAGEHSVAWTWYSGERVVATRTMKLQFSKTPYRFWYRIPAAGFDLGHYRVDVAIDGKIVDTRECDVVK